MSRRLLFYVRVLVLVLGLGLALLGVLASGGPYNYLTLPLAVTGVLLLAGSMLVGYVAEFERLFRADRGS